MRTEGTSRAYVDLEYPAVADLDVTNALRDAARAADAPHHVGIVESSDAYYAADFAGAAAAERFDRLRRAGLLAIEMEASALFVVGRLRGLRTGCILALREEMSENGERRQAGPEFERGLDRSILVAIEAIRLLIRRDVRADPGRTSMPLPVEFSAALRIVCARLDDLGATWAVTGSVGLALLGLEVRPRDLDLETDAEGAAAIEVRLAPYVVEPVTFQATEHVRSQYGAFEIGGVPVEVMGDMSIRDAAGIWHPPVDLRREATSATLDGMVVPVVRLEAQRRMYERLGRARGRAIVELARVGRSAASLERCNPLESAAGCRTCTRAKHAFRLSPHLDRGHAGDGRGGVAAGRDASGHATGSTRADRRPRCGRVPPGSRTLSRDHGWYPGDPDRD